MRIVETRQLSEAERLAMRKLMDEAFEGDFTEDDWQHALGGGHAIIGSPDRLVAHAAVVERRLRVDARELRTGYVEASAVMPDLQRTGLGTAVMAAMTDLIRERYEIGALSTGEWGFYQRVGAVAGAHVRPDADGRLLRTADEDDAVMVLRCAPTRGLNLKASIACEERSGDSW